MLEIYRLSSGEKFRQSVKIWPRLTSLI